MVYLVRKRGMGDVLWIEPLIRQLAAKHKQVIVYTKNNFLFDNYPLKNVRFISRLNLFEKFLLAFDSFFGSSLFFINLEMAYEKKPRMHFLRAYQEKARLPITLEYPKIYFSDEEKKPALSIENKLAIIHLESLTDKNYRKVYGVDWQSVVAHLKEKNFHVIQIGTEDLHINGAEYKRTTSREMIRVISTATLFIGIDSGPSHIAASLSIPALIFFGAVNPDYRHFRQLFKGYFLQQFCEFAGCYHTGHDTSGPDCKLVGKNGIPKCSLHTTEYVLKHIDLLISQYITSQPVSTIQSKLD